MELRGREVVLRSTTPDDAPILAAILSVAAAEATEIDAAVLDVLMPGMSGDMPGMSGGDGHSETAVANRPLTPVLGTFGGGTSAVMLAAGLLRRRDRARDLAKKAGRAARRSQK